MEAAASTRRLRVNIGLAQRARGPLDRSGVCELKVLQENSPENLNCPTTSVGRVSSDLNDIEERYASHECGFQN